MTTSIQKLSVLLKERALRHSASSRYSSLPFVNAAYARFSVITLFRVFNLFINCHTLSLIRAWSLHARNGDDRFNAAFWPCDGHVKMLRTSYRES